MAGSPASASSAFTLLMATFGALGIGSILVAKQNESALKEISREVAATSSSYQNAIREYLNKIKDATFLPSATDASFPSRKDIEELGQDQIRKLKRVNHPICVEICRMLIEIEAITIAMIRSNMSVLSWIPGIPLCSPMDLWEETQYFVFGLTYGDDGILLQNMIKEPKDQQMLASFADDLKLLKSSLLEEIDEILVKKSSCADNADLIRALRKTTVSVPFLQRIAAIQTSPFVSTIPLPSEYITNSALRASIHGSATNLYNLHVCRKNQDDIDAMHVEFIDAFAKLQGADASSIEKELTSLLNKFAKS
jgi:hypothetical protein